MSLSYTLVVYMLHSVLVNMACNSSLSFSIAEASWGSLWQHEEQLSTSQGRGHRPPHQPITLQYNTLHDTPHNDEAANYLRVEPLYLENISLVLSPNIKSGEDSLSLSSKSLFQSSVSFISSYEQPPLFLELNNLSLSSISHSSHLNDSHVELERRGNSTVQTPSIGFFNKSRNFRPSHGKPPLQRLSQSMASSTSPESVSSSSASPSLPDHIRSSLHSRSRLSPHQEFSSHTVVVPQVMHGRTKRSIPHTLQQVWSNHESKACSIGAFDRWTS